MAQHAKRLVTAQGLDGVVEVIQGVVETVEIPEQVDVIISEWMVRARAAAAAARAARAPHPHLASLPACLPAWLAGWLAACLSAAPPRRGCPRQSHPSSRTPPPHPCPTPQGYFLLRESMLDSVLVARDKFLKPGGALYPSHARVRRGASPCRRWAAHAAAPLPSPLTSPPPTTPTRVQMFVAPIRTNAAHQRMADFQHCMEGWGEFCDDMRQYYGVELDCLSGARGLEGGQMRWAPAAARAPRSRPRSTSAPGVAPVAEDFRREQLDYYSATAAWMDIHPSQARAGAKEGAAAHAMPRCTHASTHARKHPPTHSNTHPPSCPALPLSRCWGRPPASRRTTLPP